MDLTMSAEMKAQIDAIQKDIDDLKEIIKKHHHLTTSSEHDYDVKSKIIDKQNQIIEMLIKHNHHKADHK